MYSEWKEERTANCKNCNGRITKTARLTNGDKNHSTQDSRVVPHRGTNWAALRLTAQIGRDAVLSKSYGRGWERVFEDKYIQLTICVMTSSKALMQSHSSLTTTFETGFRGPHADTSILILLIG